MKTIEKITRFLTCFFCWLTISPLFYYLAGKWGMKKGRLSLMLVSPLFIISYLIILLWGYATYLDYERKYYFTDEDRIERITGVWLPDMDIVEYNKGVQATWRNGMSAPKGESENEDRSFSISFKKGSKKATINSGMW